MRSMIIPAALAVGIAAVAAAPAAAFAPAGPAVQAAPTSDITPASYRHRHRARVYIYAPNAYAPQQQGWVPYSQRGFADPGFAYHGNINGCAVDLGYGRWESCDKGR
jgi:hypothetical protein